MNPIQRQFSDYLVRYQERFEKIELKRSRRLPGWRTKYHRRRLVLALAFCDLLLVAGAAVIKTTPSWLFLALWGAGCFAGIAPWYLLRILTGRMSSGFSITLDEREREWRHRVTYAGYQALIWLMLIGMFYGFAISGTEHAGIRSTMMFAALLTTGAMTPTIVLGWTLPDDEGETEDD